MDKLTLSLLAGSALFNAGANTLMKFAFGGREGLLDGGFLKAALAIALNPYALLSVGSFGVSFLFLSAALTRADLSVAYPVMSGLVYVLVLAVSTLLFSERVTALRIAGMAVILLGIWLVSVG